MTRPIRRFAPLLAVVIVAAAACQPTKPPPPPLPPGVFVEYYTSVSPGSGLRSTAPHTHPQPVGGGTSSQTLLGDGSVEVDVTGAADNSNPIKTGVQIVPLRLGDLQTIQVQLAPGSHTRAGIDLFLDKDGNDDYLEWNAGGAFVGFGADVWAVDQDSTSSTLTVNSSTSFEAVSGSNAIRTLAQLQAGAEPGVGPDTMLTLFVFMGATPTTGEPPLTVSATVTSVVVNGVELLVP